MTERRHLVIYGTVQGVGFRAFARRAAQRTGILAGWVRNRTDGAVELEAEGSADAIAEFLELVRRGPSFGYVQRVESLPPGDGELTRPFAVLR